MTQQVAFLRAINVGGHIVKMEDLRRLFEAAGFDGVQTYIQSGQVIFEAPANDVAELEREIEARLQQALGYRVATFLRSLSELGEITRYVPFPGFEAEENATLYVAFVRDEPEASAQWQLLSLGDATNSFHVHQREVFWLRRRFPGEPPFSSAFLEKTLQAEATLRNMTTIRKIVAKYDVT